MSSFLETKQKIEEEQKLLQEKKKYDDEITRITEKEKLYKKNKLLPLSEDEKKLLTEYRSQGKKTIDTGKIITDEDILFKQDLQYSTELNLLKKKLKDGTITESEKQRLQELIDLKKPIKKVGKLSNIPILNIPFGKPRLPTIAIPINDENIGNVNVKKISENKYQTRIKDETGSIIENEVNVLDVDGNEITVEINNMQESTIRNKLTDRKNNLLPFGSPRKPGGKRKSKKRLIKYKRNTKKSKK